MEPFKRLANWIRHLFHAYHPFTSSSGWVRRSPKTGHAAPQVDFSTRLPPEILLSVIKENLPLSHSSLSLAERYRALCAYSRVSRIWRSVAQPELFRVIQLPNPFLAFFFTSTIFIPFNHVNLMSRTQTAFVGTPANSGEWWLARWPTAAMRPLSVYWTAVRNLVGAKSFSLAGLSGVDLAFTSLFADLRSLHFVACNFTLDTLIAAPNLERITLILPLEHDLVSSLAGYSTEAPLSSLVLLTETFFVQERTLPVVSLFLSSSFQFSNANLHATTALRHLVLSRPRGAVLPHNLTAKLYNLLPPDARLASLSIDAGCASYPEIFFALIDSPILENLERLRICARARVAQGPNANDGALEDERRNARARMAIVVVCNAREIALVEHFYSPAEVQLREQWDFYTRPFDEL